MVTGSVLDLACKEINVTLMAGLSCRMPHNVDTTAFKFFNFAIAAVSWKYGWANGINRPVKNPLKIILKKRLLYRYLGDENLMEILMSYFHINN